MNRGGVETWLMNVLRNVSRDELAFDFMVHKPDDAAYDEELLALGAGRYVCKWPSNPLVYAHDFLRILRQHGPYDVVHSHVHHFSGFVLLLAKLAGVPIRIAHGHSDTSAAQAKASGLRRAYLKGTKRLISYASTSGIAVSQKAAVSLFGKNWQADQRWKIIYCGIDFKPFEAFVDPLVVREELGIPMGTFVIGHVGRFDEAKNHTFLIDIFDAYKKINLNSMLLLIGQGRLKAEMMAKVELLGLQKDVIFVDTRTDVPRLMKGAMDLFLFPSKHEGLGLVLIEAQAAKLPCLASDNIPLEARASDSFNVMPLAASPQLWAEAADENRSFLSTDSDRLTEFTIERSILSLGSVYGR
jgi:glycosyltransferase involved in cell wall biosynthesis